jgi:hypothetical protein
VTKGLPPLPPGQQQHVDQFHASCSEVLDRYVAGFELDMNRHAIKHGPMPPERALTDLTRILARDVPANMLAGITAMAILRGIAKKREGKG